MEIALSKLFFYASMCLLILHNGSYFQPCTASGISNARLYRQLQSGTEESAEARFNYDHNHPHNRNHQGHHHRRKAHHHKQQLDNEASDVVKVAEKGDESGNNKNLAAELRVDRAKPSELLGTRYAYVIVKPADTNIGRHKHKQHRKEEEKRKQEAEELRPRAQLSEDESKRNGNGGDGGGGDGSDSESSRGRGPYYYPRQLEREIPGTPFFVCEFEDSLCDLKNDVQMKTLFEMRSARDPPIHGFTNMLAIDISTAKSPGARLVTMYFPTNGYRFGCFTMDYLLQGSGAKKFLIVQQDKENSCIWNDERPDHHGGRWRTVTINIDLRRGDPRLFIEAHFDNRQPHNNGMVAIKKVAFSYNSCARDDTNNCGRNTIRPAADQPRADEAMMGDQPVRSDADNGRFRPPSPDDFEVEVFDINSPRRRKVPKKDDYDP